jgi:hypothetical protein
LLIVNWPFKKVKILCEAMLGLEKSFWLIFSNTHLRTRESCQEEQERTGNHRERQEKAGKAKEGQEKAGKAREGQEKAGKARERQGKTGKTGQRQGRTKQGMTWQDKTSWHGMTWQWLDMAGHKMTGQDRTGRVVWDREEKDIIGKDRQERPR